MKLIEVGKTIKFGDRQGKVVAVYEHGFHLREDRIINMVMYDQIEDINIEFLD